MTGPKKEVQTPLRRGFPSIDGRWLLIATAVVIAGLCAWRATLGLSLIDDGYYAATTVRLAQGARMFVDEMFVQSLGFLAAVPFTKLWLMLFGMTGVVVALRLFYVAVAILGAVVVFRLLDRSFGRVPAFVGAVAVFIAPAYNLLSVSYDTMAALGMVLACVFTFASVRDSKRRYAAIAGAAAAFASVSHPPFTLAAFALLITLIVRTRDRRLIWAMVSGAAAVVVAFLAWLLATTSFAELRGAYDFVIGSWRLTAGPATGTRTEIHLLRFLVSMIAMWKLPLFAWFAPAAAVSVFAAHFARSPERARARGLALALLPVALAIPVFANWSAHGRPLLSLETVGGNFLIAFLVFAAGPMWVSLRGARTDPRRDLVLFALPAGLVGFWVVVMSSSADIFWASGIVGLAPIVVAVTVWWATEIGELLGVKMQAGAVASLLFALLVLLFGYGFKSDGPPLGLTTTIQSGAYAGMRTGAGRAAEVADLARLSQKWVGPTTTVATVNLPGGYLVTGGVPLTNVVWLDAGPFDSFTVQYLDRAGRWPDVVFVPLNKLNQPESVVYSSSFLSAVLSRYTLVDTSDVAGVAVYTAAGIGPVKP